MATDSLRKVGNEQHRKAEFGDYLRQHQSQLFGYIHSLVRDLNDADDLFQQTTAILWNKFDEFDRGRSFVAWGCGVARWEAANFLRARGRQRLYFTDDLNLLLIETHADMKPDDFEDRREALSSCLHKLRERDRQLVDECYSAEAGVSAVAGKHGRSAQSVHNSLRRIRRALFECIRRTLAQETQPDMLS